MIDGSIKPQYLLNNILQATNKDNNLFNTECFYISKIKSSPHFTSTPCVWQNLGRSWFQVLHQKQWSPCWLEEKKPSQLLNLALPKAANFSDHFLQCVVLSNLVPIPYNV